MTNTEKTVQKIKNNIEQMLLQITILENVKANTEMKSSASNEVATIAYNATISGDKKIESFMKNLPKEKKELIKSPFSKGVSVANAKFDGEIPEDMVNDAILTIYNKLQKVKKEREKVKTQERLQIIRENQALQIVFPDNQALSQFLKTNDEKSQVYKDAVSQGLAIMVEQERMESEAMAFLKLEQELFNLSQENLEKVFVLVSAKLQKPAQKKRA